MKKIKILTLFVLLCFLNSCRMKEERITVEITPSDANIMEIATEIYDADILQKIANYRGNLTELQATYPVECLRMYGNLYRVSYRGEESVVVLLFSASGKCLFGQVYPAVTRKSDFNGLIAKTIAEVQVMDPAGIYPFLYTGRNDTPRMSSHATKDGYWITVEYDTNLVVVRIIEELI